MTKIDAYIAIPYSHEDSKVRHERCLAADAYLAKLTQEGYIVHSPISHSHRASVNHELPKDWEYWEKCCRRYMNCCNELHVLMLDGWEQSVGVANEIKIAKELKMNIKYVKP